MSRFKRQARKGPKSDPFASAVVDGGGKRQSIILAQARQTGVLKMSNRDLTEFPSDALDLLGDAERDADSDKWWECADLTSIDLANNSIQSLPAGVGALEWLVNLNMSHNKLSSVPPELFELPGLKKVDFSFNCLSSLPDNVGYAPELVHLSLNDNRFATLPPSLDQLGSLQVLEVNNNDLQELPRLQARQLVKLTLNNNQLRQLPPMRGLQQLQSLEVTKNQLSELPSFEGLSKLTLLDVSFNRLSHIPPLPKECKLAQVSLANNSLKSCGELSVCAQLSTLDLRSNQIKEVPASFVQLQQLKILDVSNNDLGDVPGQIGTLPQLNKLLLDGNPLRKIPRGKLSQGIQKLKKYLVSRLTEAELAECKGEDGAAGGEQQSLEYAIRDGSATRSISLKNRRLTRVPDEIFAIELEVMDVSENNIIRLPDDLRVHSRTLKKLVLDRNGFDHFPPVLQHMSAMLELSVAKNQIETLPQSLSLPLRFLDLRNNRLRVFPKAIFDLANTLEHLHLAYNQMVEVPSLDSLRQLQTLDLGNNRIRTIGEGIRAMSRLSFLNLADNNFDRLPAELGVCNHHTLKTLLVNGNPQRLIRHDVLRSSSEHIIAAIRKTLPQDSHLFAGGAAPAQTKPRAAEGGKVAELEARIAACAEQLEDFSLSSAKKYAVKKDMARAKADLIREKRRIAKAAAQ